MPFTSFSARATALLAAASFAVLPAAVTPSASAAQPSFKVSPGAGNFGKVTLTNSAAKTFTVKNTSKVPLMFDVSDVVSPDNYAVDLPSSGNGHCMVDAGSETHYWGVAPGGTCDFTIEYTPTEDLDAETPAARFANKGSLLVSAYSAAIEDDYVHGPASGVLNTKTVKLNAKAVAPKVKVVPGTLNFGKMANGEVAVRTAEIVNQSDIPLTMLPSPTFFLDSFDFVFVASTEGDGECHTSDSLYWTVLPGESCTVRVEADDPSGNDSQEMDIEVVRGVGTGYQPATPAEIIARVEFDVKARGGN